ncbi:MAG: hypothetical protein CVV25_08890 [Ignavibacteriae bacterium HGW-Ignavibacteriae-4]|nr:MAG: hypothetical protein CVV25_08890 [Ignavibacteriae bacterium HGW-Ignavibacteriae-4]
MHRYILIVLLFLSSIPLLLSEEIVSLDILFEKYECNEEEFELINPDFSSNSDFKKFKTIITEKCMEGVNFAHKYTIVTWGCGTNCQYTVLVDRTNGKIYDGITSTYGVNFRIDSQLIVVNDATNISESSTPIDTTRYYVINEGVLEEIIP